MKTLPDLILGQEGIAVDMSDGRNSEETWYLDCEGDGTRSSISRYGEAVAKVRVIFPALLAGTSDDVYSDIRDAVRRHGQKHGI